MDERIKLLSQKLLKKVLPSVVFYLNKLNKQFLEIHHRDALNLSSIPQYKIYKDGRITRFNYVPIQHIPAQDRVYYDPRDDYREIVLGNIFDLKECPFFETYKEVVFFHNNEKNAYIYYAGRVIYYCQNLANEYKEINDLIEMADKLEIKTCTRAMIVEKTKSVKLC